MKLVEHQIISGHVIEVQRSWMNVNAELKTSRAPRVAGKSSAKKIARNDKASERQLARLINTNFEAGDLWLTLKYSDFRLPATKAEAKKEIQKFLRKIRNAYEKETGKKLKYIYCTSTKSTKTGREVRVHHHMVLNRLAYETLCKYWPAEEMSYTLLDGRKDHTDLANYIIKNASKTANENKWNCSKNLDKPIVTEPVEVEDLDIKPIKGAEVREKRVIIDEEAGFSSAYLRAVLEEKPMVRGGKVCFRKKQNRRRKNEKEEYFE